MLLVMNIKNIMVLLKDLKTYLIGYYIYLIHYIKNKQTKIFSLRDTHMVQKAKQFFKLLKTVVFLNIDYKKDIIVERLYLVLLKNTLQAKVMPIKKKCMNNLQEHKVLI